jgi:hypothetical protein
MMDHGRLTAFPVTVSMAVLSTFLLLARLLVTSDGALRLLEMSPAGTLVRGMIWTPLTTGLCEQASIKSLVAIVLLLLGGAHAEPVVGSTYVLQSSSKPTNRRLSEFLKQVVLAQVLGSVFALFVASIMYAMTYNETYFFSPVTGLAGIDASVLVLVASTPGR